MEDDFDFEGAVRDDQALLRAGAEGDAASDCSAGSDMQDIELAEALYMDPRNSNNMSRSLKIVDVEDVRRLGAVDGYMYTFISEAEGPMLSSMSQKQILVLLHVLNSPLHSTHVVETECLKPVFSPVDGSLEKLVETQRLEDRDGASRDEEEHGKILSRAVDEIPSDTVCDYRETGNSRVVDQKVVSVGDILVSPVTVRYAIRVRSTRSARALHPSPRGGGHCWALPVAGRGR